MTRSTLDTARKLDRAMSLRSGGHQCVLLDYETQVGFCWWVFPVVLRKKAEVDQYTLTKASYNNVGKWTSNPSRRKEPTRGFFLFLKARSTCYLSYCMAKCLPYLEN